MSYPDVLNNKYLPKFYSLATYILLIVIGSSACGQDSEGIPTEYNQLQLNSKHSLTIDDAQLEFESQTPDGQETILWDSGNIDLKEQSGILHSSIYLQDSFLTASSWAPVNYEFIRIELILERNGINESSYNSIVNQDYREPQNGGWQLSASKRVLTISKPIDSFVTSARVVLSVTNPDKYFSNHSSNGTMHDDFGSQTLTANFSRPLLRLGSKDLLDKNKAYLSVMTYNIKSGQIPGSIKPIADYINAQNPDIVLLQEVDVLTERTGQVDQIEELKKLTGMYGFFSRTIDLEGGAYGIALLSRYPILKRESLSLEVPYVGGWYEKRALQIATISVEGFNLTLANTHLHLTANYNEREANKLIHSLKESVGENDCLILGGDINAKPNSKTYQSIAQTYTDTGHLYGDSNDRRIDYLFSQIAAPIDYQVLDSDLSDHYPILSTYNINNCK